MEEPVTDKLLLEWLKQDKLMVKLAKVRTLGSSEVWKFFGFLEKDGIPIQSLLSYIYCSECLSSGQLKKYSKGISTGNLHKHLTDIHGRNTKERVEAESAQKLTKYFQGKVKPKTKSDEKWKLGRELALWFCRDLLPFHTANKAGFIDFSLCHGIIKEQSTMPDASSIARTATSDIFRWTYDGVKKLIANTPDSLALTLDCWTDNNRRTAYITYTMHWVTSDWKLQSLSLGTSRFSHPHTGEAIAENVKNVLTEFKLLNKKLTATTDNGSNVIKGLRLSNLHRVPCIAHGLHNLIKSDLLGDKKNQVVDSEIHNVKQMLIKLRKVHQALIYKYDELSSAEGNKDELPIVQNCVEIENIMQTDDQFSFGQEKPEDETLREANGSGTTTLKKDLPTRWSSTQTMITSFFKIKGSIKRVLEKNQLYDKILTTSEVNYAKQLKNILSIFELTTTVLQGSDYPSLNLALLFRSEIFTKLESHVSDSELEKKLKEILRQNIHKRFPLTDEMVGCALIDPAMKRLCVIEEYLNSKGTNKKDFLLEMLKKYDCIAQDVVKSQELQQDSESASSESPGPSDPKKFCALKLQLLKKHSKFIAEDSVEAEIKKYLIVGQFSDKPLEWWKDNECSFPTIAKLARILFGIPATSAPSERAFSTAGLVVTAKRASLNPLLVKRILFVHDNFDIAKDFLLKSKD